MAKITVHRNKHLASNEIELTLTMRGDPPSVVGAIVNGLPREALMKIKAALDQYARPLEAKRELAARRAARKARA